MENSGFNRGEQKKKKNQKEKKTISPSLLGRGAAVGDKLNTIDPLRRDDTSLFSRASLFISLLNALLSLSKNLERLSYKTTKTLTGNRATVDRWVRQSADTFDLSKTVAV